MVNQSVGYDVGDDVGDGYLSLGCSSPLQKGGNRILSPPFEGGFRGISPFVRIKNNFSNILGSPAVMVIIKTYSTADQITQVWQLRNNAPRIERK